MRSARKRAVEWKPANDPDGRYSTGIPDFDRLTGGGLARGSHALFSFDETIGLDDLDLLLFPTYLNFLYHSRGLICVLPSRDSPHGFRSRLTTYATRRRFDARVRIVDYVGEDEGLSYVVNLALKATAVQRKAAMAKMVVAERAAQGGHKRPFIESNAFETIDTLMGPETALRMFFHGIKRARMVQNLVIGLLGPGLGCAAGVRRMADAEFALHREEVGLIIRGVRPSFPSCVVTEDPVLGRPHVAFVPKPA
jgi:hypothetical protein